MKSLTSFAFQLYVAFVFVGATTLFGDEPRGVSDEASLIDDAQVVYYANQFGEITPSEGGKYLCEIQTKPESPWSVGIRFNVQKDVKKGERLTLRFKAKGIRAQTESGLAVVIPFFERNGEPYTKSLFETVEISGEWQNYVFAFKSAQEYKANESACGVFLGTQAQTLEVSDVELIQGGDGKAASVIGLYPGAESDAHWRKAALERIEKYRKGNLVVRTFDKNNAPISNAVVSVRQTNSRFLWGTCVVASRLLENSVDAEKYRQFLKEYCNVVVFENDLKWFAWRDPNARQNVFKALEWLEENNISVRGHCLVWSGWRNAPQDWRELKYSPEELRKRVKEHIIDEATALSGKLIDWDVVNEPYDNNDVWKILGKDEIGEWFQTARQADPNARLYVNDYGILSGEGNDREKQDFYFSLVKSLLNVGAPIGGIGFQGHFGSRGTSPEKIVEIIERFSQLGLPVAITEHDVDARDDDFHAQFTRDFLTAVFSCPSVDKFLVWGFWEKAHWRPNAAYFRENWEPTPAGKEFAKIVGEEWRTNETGVSNQDGFFQTRAFLGDYEIEVKTTDGAQKKTATVNSNDENYVEFVFP